MDNDAAINKRSDFIEKAKLSAFLIGSVVFGVFQRKNLAFANKYKFGLGISIAGAISYSAVYWASYFKII
jgi:hypothetical protein